MKNGMYRLQKPDNEAVKEYLPGTPERTELKQKLMSLKNTEIEIPLIIGGKEIKTGNIGTCVIPHNHQHVLARYHMAGEKELNLAVETSIQAKKEWENMP